MFRVILFFLSLVLVIFLIRNLLIKNKENRLFKERLKKLDEYDSALKEITSSLKELCEMEPVIRSESLQESTKQLIEQVFRILEMYKDSPSNLNDRGKRILNNYLSSYKEIIGKFIYLQMRGVSETSLEKHEKQILNMIQHLQEIFSKIENKFFENELENLEINIKSVTEGLKLDDP